MRRFGNLGKKKVIIGMIHLLPLPGTPFFQEGNMEASLEKAVADARALYAGGADGCLIQTVDRIYPPGEDDDYARVAAVAAITKSVADATGPEFQIGVQIMVNALKASLAVVKVCGGSFIRCTALVGATLTPSGMVEAKPLDFLNYRTHLGAGHIDLIAEVQSRHFSWMGGERSVPEVARLASRAGATAVEVSHMDEEANAKLVREIKQAMPDMPVILGGYTNHENAARRLAEADGAFVGACLQADGWGSHVDIERVREYVGIVSRLG